MQNHASREFMLEYHFFSNGSKSLQEVFVILSVDSLRASVSTLKEKIIYKLASFIIETS